MGGYYLYKKWISAVLGQTNHGSAGTAGSFTEWEDSWQQAITDIHAEMLWSFDTANENYTFSDSTKKADNYVLFS